MLEIVRQQAIEAGFSDVYERETFADLVAQPHPDLQEWIEDAAVSVPLLETSVTPVSFGAFRVDNARILALYTAPEYQERGLASRLLKTFIDRARKHGTPRLEVHAPRNAVSFFEHHDFCRQNEVLRRGLKLIEMHRPLNRST